MRLKEEELNTINGGGISATYLNAIIRGASFLYDLGMAFGTTLRQLKSKTRC
ncbi:MAG: hypothetical protein ACI4WW_06420 [Candidatus Coprovivens sp.]